MSTLAVSAMAVGLFLLLVIPAAPLVAIPAVACLGFALRYGE